MVLEVLICLLQDKEVLKKYPFTNTILEMKPCTHMNKVYCCIHTTYKTAPFIETTKRTVTLYKYNLT